MPYAVIGPKTGQVLVRTPTRKNLPAFSRIEWLCQEVRDYEADYRLVTFNGLGAEAGLTAYGPNGYDATLVPASVCEHYYLAGDIVSRLGDGHVGVLVP
jgi:hypothetical protein